MTNTLHRQGTREGLSRDYVIFFHTAVGFNREGAGPKMQRFLRLALEEGPVNIGVNKENLVTAGGNVEKMIAGIHDGSHATATFSSLEAIRRLVRKLKQEDLGLSLVISGLTDEVDEMLRAEGIVRHSIEHSIGILGRTERLPTEQVLEITSMCGHGCVSHNHARKMIDWTKLGKLKPRQAATYLARPCSCGAFNIDRAEELLKKSIDMA
jgi:hypothetical protein